MNLTVRERKLVAVGILVLLIAAVWLGVVRPIVGGFHARADERDRLVREQTRGERILAQLPYWRARDAALRVDAPAFALPIRQPALAGEAAVELVSTAVTRTGGEVRAIREQSAADGLAKIHADLRLNLTQLTGLLKLLEDQRPFAIVQTLTIAADPATSAGRLSTLDVGIDLAIPYAVTNG